MSTNVKNSNGLFQSMEVERLVRYKKNVPGARKEINKFIKDNNFTPLTKEENKERMDKLIANNKREKINFPAFKRFLKI